MSYAIPEEFAFPLKDGEDVECGITTQDYFAAKALQGLLANPNNDATAQGFAEYAYEHAEAMMRVRLNLSIERLKRRA